jgi:exosortase/archaeosortase family protein
VLSRDFADQNFPCKIFIAVVKGLNIVKAVLQQQISIGFKFLRHFTRTNHGKILLCGLLVGLIYLPSWIRFITVFTLIGSIFPLVSLSATYLGLTELWDNRQQIARYSASSISRKWGHCIIWFSIALFPFCLTKVWAQGFIWSLVLIGIAFSSWGYKFFRQFWCPVLLILSTAYPPLILSILGRLWKILTPPLILEKLMAWAGSIYLKLFGLSVILDGTQLTLSSGGVNVLPGCNGFEMIVTIIAVTVLVGVAFKLDRAKILTLTFLGAILAIILNAGRIALMAIAVAYWGEHSFEFWHGFWGGQIFASVLFTMYYYLVIWSLPNSTVSKMKSLDQTAYLTVEGEVP